MARSPQGMVTWSTILSRTPNGRCSRCNSRAEPKRPCPPTLIAFRLAFSRTDKRASPGGEVRAGSAMSTSRCALLTLLSLDSILQALIEGGRHVPRRYDSTLRQMQAQRTREAVLDAGQALITETGYARMTMRAIAERAGVSVDTIYLHFRSKAAVLKALLDIAVGGDEAPIPVADRDWVHQIRGQPGARPALAEFAASVTSVHARL